MRHVLVDAAKKYDKVILPGYTHMQHAQPVLLSHHLLAYSWMFARDFTRLRPPLMPPTTARWVLPRLPVRAIRSIAR